LNQSCELNMKKPKNTPFYERPAFEYAIAKSESQNCLGSGEALVQGCLCLRISNIHNEVKTKTYLWVRYGNIMDFRKRLLEVHRTAPLDFLLKSTVKLMAVRKGQSCVWCEESMEQGSIEVALVNANDSIAMKKVLFLHDACKDDLADALLFWLMPPSN